jgi:hypothetical protein
MRELDTKPGTVFSSTRRSRPAAPSVLLFRRGVVGEIGAALATLAHRKGAS